MKAIYNMDKNPLEFKFIKGQLSSFIGLKILKSLKAQNELTEKLKNQALKQGFNPVGIARVPGSSRLQLRTNALERWVNAGYQADMEWMTNPTRKNIEMLLEGVTSILAVGLNYYVDVKKSPENLSIARYGWGKDYHKIIKKRLKKIGEWLEKEKPNCKWKVCVDSSPIMDKAWAEEAGLGWIGKNSNLINQTRGSWMFLGHLLCTEPLTPDNPEKSLCGSCEKCIKACPTDAITEPFVVDAKKCLAYHTIENREAQLPDDIAKSLGSWVAGCDICQEVCPWNQKALPSSNDPEIMPRDWILKLTKQQALSWDDETWTKNLNSSALRRIKPWMWRRNASATNKNITNTF